MAENVVLTSCLCNHVCPVAMHKLKAAGSLFAAALSRRLGSCHRNELLGLGDMASLLGALFVRLLVLQHFNAAYLAHT